MLSLLRYYRCLFMIIAPKKMNAAAINAQSKMLIGEIMPINSIITAKTSIMMPTVFILLSLTVLPRTTMLYLPPRPIHCLAKSTSFIIPSDPFKSISIAACESDFISSGYSVSYAGFITD